MHITSQNHSIDYPLLGLTLLLTLFGLVMLASASNVLGFERFGDNYYFTKQQLVHVGVGLIALLIWFYAFIAGLAPSVVRAAVMISFILIGQVLNRDANIYIDINLSHCLTSCNSYQQC